jgi:hypothetical protein
MKKPKSLLGVFDRNLDIDAFYIIHGSMNPFPSVPADRLQPRLQVLDMLIYDFASLPDNILPERFQLLPTLSRSGLLISWIILVHAGPLRSLLTGQ